LTETKNGIGRQLGVGRVGETERKTYEIYLRGTPKREGAVVGAATGCSTRSLSAIASKWMDLRGGFPLTNRSLESERAIRGKRKKGTPLRPCSGVSFRARWEGWWKGERREEGDKKGRRGEERETSQTTTTTREGASDSRFLHQI